MAKTIQIRNVPDTVYRILKTRAADAGLSLSDYVLHELRKLVTRPTKEEILDRLSKLPRVIAHETSAEVVRNGREERMRELDRRTDPRLRRRR